MQFIDIVYQLQITLYAALFGCVLAAVYDALKIIRMLVGASPIGAGELKLPAKLPVYRLSKNGFFAHLSAGVRDIIFIQITDILYGVAVSVSFCIFLYSFNSGRFRWYLLLAAAVGFFACYCSLGRLTVYLSGYIVSVIKAAVGFLMYLLMLPVRFAGRWLGKLFSPVIGLVRRYLLSVKTEKYRKKLCRMAEFR